MRPELKEELEKIEDLQGYYDELVSSHTQTYYAKEDAKEAELKIREGIAMDKQLYKKDGETLDLGQVKATSLNGAISVFYGGEDKLEVAADLKNEYLEDIKKGNINQKQIEGLELKRATVKEASGMAKDAREELKTHIDPDIVDAMDMLAIEEVKLIKENDDAEKGIEPKKKKDTSETYDILKEIKAKLGIV